MDNSTNQIYSEIGELESVIIHTPGPEVENMTPENAERALYSDILNLNVGIKEYEQFKGVLQKMTKVYEVNDLFTDILENQKVKNELVAKICSNERKHDVADQLLEMNADELSKQLLEGVVMMKDNLTKYLSKERYSLRPLHNFFFTRDASITIFDKVLIGRMASNVRAREAMIMEAIFDSHPDFNTQIINPVSHPKYHENITIEGGDIIVARDDVILVGIGSRTTAEGVDFLIERLKKQNTKRHILVQELPHKPESFIHLDMVFTFLDKDQCMVYDPVILKPNKFNTAHITIDNGKVTSIKHIENLLQGLNSLGFDIKPVFCGGQSDLWIQEREQWQCAANFLALKPGVIIGYERNVNTVEELSKNGYNVVKAEEVISGNVTKEGMGKCVITIEGSELSRGGGGARCMSMPVRRTSVNWR